MSVATSGTQPPHPVPARVHAFTSATEVEPVLADRAADRAARDVVARADLRLVVESDGAAGTAARADQEIEGALGNGHPAPADVEQRRVRRRVADQHAAEETRPVGGEHELLVDAAGRSSTTRRWALVPAVSSANASPKLATSTPSSFSLVERSAPVKVGVPPQRRSASVSAIA